MAKQYRLCFQLAEIWSWKPDHIQAVHDNHKRLHYIQLKAAFLLFFSPAGWWAPSQLDVADWAEPGPWWCRAGPNQPGGGQHLEVPRGFVTSENTGTTYSQETPSTTSDLQINWIQVNLWREYTLDIIYLLALLLGTHSPSQFPFFLLLLTYLLHMASMSYRYQTMLSPTQVRFNLET